MLEHLDDPRPPEPSARALAAIYARSAARRRRRSLALSGVLATVVLAAGVSVGLLVPRSPTDIGAASLAARTDGLSPGLAVPAADLTGAVFPNDADGFALSAGPGRTALVGTTDGGQTWRVVDGDLPSGSSAQLDFASPTEGFLWGGPPTTNGELPLWVTANGGRSWTRAPIGPVVSDVSAIGAAAWAVVGTCPVAATPSATSCPVVLEESVDGGLSWTPSAAAPPIEESTAPSYSDQDVELARMTRAHAYLLSFDPLGESAALAGLAYTADAGATWRMLPDPCTRGYDYAEIAGSGTDDLWLLCAGLPSAGEQAKALYRSFDGGATWALAASAPLGELTGGLGPAVTGSISIEGYVAPVSLGHDNLAVVDATTAWLFPSHGSVAKTTNGGQTWVPVRSLAAMSSIGASGNIVFADPTHGWVDGPGVGIWTTADATSWHELGQ
jgi:hypothetical protein